MKNKFFFLWLIFIIIIFFILQFIPGFTEIFLLNKSAIDSYQIWRFPTAIFLHGDLTHLIFNIFALFIFGLALENIIGSKRFLAVFLFSGIIANIIAVNFYESSLGASGAIYGILGTLTILRPFMIVWTFGMIMPMFIASILWISADVLRTLGAFGSTNIGSIAHLSGIAVGILIGLFLKIKIYKK